MGIDHLKIRVLLPITRIMSKVRLRWKSIPESKPQVETYYREPSKAGEEEQMSTAACKTLNKRFPVVFTDEFQVSKLLPTIIQARLPLITVMPPSIVETWVMRLEIPKKRLRRRRETI
jgi:hypothetical protein